MPEAQKIGDAIREFLKLKGSEDGIRIARVLNAWEKVNSPFIVAATVSKYYLNGTLHVTFSSSVARNTVLKNKAGIMFKINKFLNTEGAPLVTNIVLR